MAMKLIKKTADYKIFVRGDERYAVQDSSGKPVNGEEKVRILVEEELIKVTVPAPKEEAPEAEEAASDEVAEATVDDTEDAPAEDNTAEPEPSPSPSLKRLRKNLSPTQRIRLHQKRARKKKRSDASSQIIAKEPARAGFFVCCRSARLSSLIALHLTLR